MGQYYKYKCENCGFEQTYKDGVGFAGRAEYEEGLELGKQFKSDVFDGKYGDFLKTIAESDKKNELEFSCQNSWFQCNKCYETVKMRHKTIYLRFPNDEFLFFSVGLRHECPKCGSKDIDYMDFDEYTNCPKCKEYRFHLYEEGFWD
jgi:Zn finger protein HypA/HybF involved in hydrogenase expression